jgi:histidinol-phosphatase (PHP family)
MLIPITKAKCTPQSLQKTFEDFLVEARRLQQAYKSQINILVGCEIEFITIEYKQYIADLRQQHGIDYVVGSLHHVNGIPIDFSPQLYTTALEKHHNNLHDLFASYFDEQYQMLQAVHPEVVGHFDLIRIFRTEPNAGINEAVWDKITRNVELVIRYGGLFEINSRAWKKGLKDAYPQRDVFKVINCITISVSPVNTISYPPSYYS